MNNNKPLKIGELFMGKTTAWKEATGQQNINFCLPYSLLNELDRLKDVTGGTRSEMIRTAIRLYIKMKMDQLAEQERKALENYHVRQQNQRRQVNTGLLPDY